jgi:hypothetical protein
MNPQLTARQSQALCHIGNDWAPAANGILSSTLLSLQQRKLIEGRMTPGCIVFSAYNSRGYQWRRAPGARLKPILKNCPITFKVGDVVIATKEIWRYDGRSTLRPGDKATVTHVYRVNPESAQIINIEPHVGLPMGDIVCFENVPLKLDEPVYYGLTFMNVLQVRADGTPHLFKREQDARVENPEMKLVKVAVRIIG